MELKPKMVFSVNFVEEGKLENDEHMEEVIIIIDYSTNPIPVALKKAKEASKLIKTYMFLSNKRIVPLEVLFIGLAYE